MPFRSWLMAQAIQSREGNRDTQESWCTRTVRSSNRSCFRDSKKVRSTVWNYRRASRRWSGLERKESGDVMAECRYLATHSTSLTANLPHRFGRRLNGGHLLDGPLPTGICGKSSCQPNRKQEFGFTFAK